MKRSLLVVIIMSFIFRQPAVSFSASEDPVAAVGLDVAADNSPVCPGKVFPAGLEEISIGFRLQKEETFKKLHARWIAVDVGDAAPANTEIGDATVNVNSGRSGRFRYTLPRPLPVGEYKTVITADGNPWKELPFSIRDQETSAALEKPEDFFPLTKGREWIYDFVMEGGEGTTVSLPGVTRSPDGKLRATATYRVVDVGPDGAHIEMLRNDDLSSEEWWRIDEKGFSVVKRKIGEDVIIFDPPQLLLPAGLKVHKEWNYKAGKTQQKFHAWGPLPMTSMKETRPGYVVLIGEPASKPTSSAQRDVVPGIGIVNDVIITTLNGNRLMKQQAILREIRESK